MTIVQRVPQLEGIDCISASLNDLIINLSGCLSVFIHTVLKFDLAHVSHGTSTDQKITLAQYSLNLWMLGGKGSKNTSRDLFFAILKKHWVLNNCVDITSRDS